MEGNRKEIVMPVVTPVQYSVKHYNFFKRLCRWATYTRQWRMVEDWYCILPNNVKIVIPKDFVFDGASVPKVLRSLLSPVGVLYLAGIIHDFSYKYNKLIAVNVDRSRYDYKVDAGKVYFDNLFREVGDATNGMFFINRLALMVLSVFGFVAWNRHRKRIPVLDWK